MRCHVTAADNFLAWIAGEGLTLGACTQADLERWMTDPAFPYCDELIATRRGKAKIGAPGDAPWLFAGRRPVPPYRRVVVRHCRRCHRTAQAS